MRMAKQLTEIAACVRRRSHLRSPRGGRLPISQPRERFEPGRQPRGRHRRARGALLVDFEQGITRGHFALNAFQIRIDFDDLLMHVCM